MSHIRELLIDQFEAYFDAMNQLNPLPDWQHDRTVYKDLSNMELIKWLGAIAQCHVDLKKMARPALIEYGKAKRATKAITQP